MAASVILTIIIMETLSSGPGPVGLIVSMTMPIVLGGPMVFILTLRHEQLRHANAQLARVASTDWLTGCSSRGAFTHHVTEQLERHADAGGVLLVVDVDNFKVVNDQFGHDDGDKALCQIAEAITEAAGDDAMVGRLGGEEFGVFIANADTATADRLAEQIREAVAAIDFAPQGSHWRLSVSIGGASYTGTVPYSALYRHADQQLYQAKNTGRDRVEIVQAA